MQNAVIIDDHPTVEELRDANAADIRRYRDRLRSLVACRMISPDIYHPPELHLLDEPVWMLDIARDTLAEFRRDHPAGLPATPASVRITSRYCSKACEAFDAEVVRQQRLPLSGDLDL